MTRTRILLLLAFVGSGVCWWPARIEPSLDFPRWILLAPVAFLSAASVLLLGGEGWSAVVAATAGGSFAGMLSSVILWPWSDGIAQSYALIVVMIGTAAAAGAALIGSRAAFLAARRWPLLSGAAKGALWIVFGLCLAVGPALLAITKPLVKRRVARNESIAAVRFASLKKALQLASADRGAAKSICAGQSLDRYYSGPPFTKDDWIRISGNYVEEDKYVYMISCRQQRKYLLEARPKMPRVYGYGARIFCADESGEVACDLQWNGP
ncbi:hypothetical protein ACPOL_5854 [Acidisarcina polymorpha]|uniref:Uncharacterized protein n=1 Tax=Acidisarcina polymorpha TaxID=2211140 RepID=A0A2Z5G7Y4_9BACT|nr:hypothetical protein [Acidisarcina polymorpha]AXC15098.1 hypothetical protein ACPOL_5854 [Acidisarcina polymorpha]